MTIIYQLLQFYLLICMRIQQSIFIIICKESTLIFRSAVRAFTDKFRRPINRFLQVALYFLLLILIVDSTLTKMNYMDNWLATQIIFTYRCFKYFYMFHFMCMFRILWKVIYFIKNYIILHYTLDFKYGDHSLYSLFTGVFVTNYAN